MSTGRIHPKGSKIIKVMSFEGRGGSPGGDHPLNSALNKAFNKGPIDNNRLPLAGIQHCYISSIQAARFASHCPLSSLEVDAVHVGFYYGIICV